MKISCVKSKNDHSSFKFFKGIGFDVYELEDLEQTDNKLKELVLQNYTTIILSNEVARFFRRYYKKIQKN